MKKIFVLFVLACAAFSLNAQSLIGKELKSKESIVLYLIEQEKLAHDLYSVLDTIWVTEIFNRLSGDERNHMEKLNAVAVDFMMVVPNHFNEYLPGQYINENLRHLYHDLLLDANLSLEDAYRTCANLEERKILDLRAALKQPNFELETLTYKALLIGAEDNFKLFLRALLEMNAGYQPIHFSNSEFEALTKNFMSDDAWRVLNTNQKTQMRIGLF